jgi:hypothetical protein
VKVKYLIALLQQHDPDHRVVYGDTECGKLTVYAVETTTYEHYHGDGTPAYSTEPAVLLVGK